MPNLLPVLLVLLLTGTTAFGQYRPILSADLEEEVFYKVIVEEDSVEEVSDLTIVNIDVIDGLVYRRAFLRQGFEPDSLIGHVREDSLAGQVFFRPLNAPAEVLVYDISLEEGDSFNIALNWCDGFPDDRLPVVSAVTQVGGRRLLTFDRSFRVGNECLPLQFVEGVGPSATLVWATDRTGSLRFCRMRRNGELVFPAGTVDQCGLDVTATEDRLPEQLRFYPNPVSDRLFIEGWQEGDRVLIVDLLGRPAELSVQTGEGDTRQLPAGYYQLILLRNGSPLAIGRMIRS